MIDQLKEQIKQVALARREAQSTMDTARAARNKWETENADMLAEVALTTSRVNDAEALLRELTLEAYAFTGNKAPAKGVGIREVTKLDYNPGEAFDWAVAHRMALTLDKIAFEKIVKASPLPFVTITYPPQATIASNLEE